jgi:hypothetical protein
MCSACRIPLDPNGDIGVFTASVCAHSVCEPCWRGLDANNNGEAPSDQIRVHEYCGGQRCLITSSQVTAVKYGSWRHHCEGIRLCEAVIHPSVAEMFANRLRVMSAQQLDTGVKDLEVAHHKIATLFNDRDWQPEVRFALAKSRGRADCSTFHVPPIDAHLVTEKLRDIRKVRSKALANLEKSGKHNLSDDDEISKFCRDKPPNGNIWWDVFYMIKLEELEMFRDVIKTLSDHIPEHARRDSGVGKRKTEADSTVSKKGQSAGQRAARLRRDLDSALMEAEQNENAIDPKDSCSNAGSQGSASQLSAAATQLEATERQRQQSMQLSTIMALMDKLANPALPAAHRAFLEKQLVYYENQISSSQDQSMSTPTKTQSMSTPTKQASLTGDPAP